MSSSNDNIAHLIQDAKALFQQTFQPPPTLSCTSSSYHYCTCAPGRVNLIGEHTDYTEGLVLPMCINYSTVCYGTGNVVKKSSFSPSDDENRGVCRIVSTNQGGSSNIFTFDASTEIEKVKEPKWVNYILGVVAQYIPDLKIDNNEEEDEYILSFDLAIAGDVPLGSGLSSSASLEVSVARFLECVLDGEKNLSFSSVWKCNETNRKKSIERAVRCRKAENVFADSPCGIMDQYVSSCGKKDCVLMIDCRSLDYQEVCMGGKDVEEEKEKEKPAVVVCNSHVSHSIANGEYPIRVSQCQTATSILQKFVTSAKIESLRDATLDHLSKCQDKMDEVIYKRAKHVITENNRVLKAVQALQGGEWEVMGHLMNESHDSLKHDFQVSCKEVDVLVDLARSYKGVYGSRITGGGFGGCTVTLVKREDVDGLMQHLKEGYQEKCGLDCSCFVTDAADGSRVIQL